jgi:type I restriction enzyme R subunit
MLTKANWVRRALFLADRNALVTQAKNSFNDLLPHLTTVDITKEKEDTTSRMVFSTYPTIMNRIDGERTDDNRFYGPGHFDLIIVDEAHRSVYSKYKAIFDYFDAITIGLTATPKSEVDKNTYELFYTHDHDPTYAYELKTAVDDKFLTPPKALSVPIKFQREGVKYNDLTDEEKEQYELTFRDEETGDMPEEIDSSALNAWLFNTNTVDKVLAYTMENGVKVEGGDKLGKTIIFAKSHKHAMFIQERFDKMYPHLAGKFLRVIDNYENYAQDLLDNFSDKEKMPQIAVSVDMLDTGIDVPEIVNLVFFKIVRSSSKFWQMIGRGTRLCKDLFGPGLDKQHFFIFDFCQNFEFFNQFPEGIEPVMVSGVTERIFNARLRIAEEFRESAYHGEDYQNLRTELLDWCHACVAKLDPDSFVVRAHLRYVDQFSKRAVWDNLSTGQILDIETHLSHLIAPYDDDEMARRFDLLMLNLQLSLIDKSPRQQGYIRQIIRIARDLSRKNNIPSVAEKMETITLIQTTEFWQTTDLLIIERLRKDLRDLIKFIDKSEQIVVYTDFEDEINLSGVTDHDLLNSYQRLDSYKQRVEKYIRQNQNHLTIHRLRNNIPITHSEFEELEKILFDGEERGTKSDFEREFGHKPLGIFIRSILGMDVNAAKGAFSEFMNKGNLSADQITFINNIIDFLTVNGTIDNSMLFEPPFTDINDQGLLGVFQEEEAEKIISIITQINNNAMTA